MNMSLKYYGLLSLAIIVLDRITKYCVMYTVSEEIQITPFLSFVVTMNRGFSWSMFHSSNNAVFFCVSAVISFITICLMYHAYYLYQKQISIMGEIMIIAGSISNIIDRIFYDGVIDFILISYKQYAWPIFNIADIFIVFGVLLIFFVTCYES